MDTGGEQSAESYKRAIVAPFEDFCLSKLDGRCGSLGFFQIRFRIPQRNRSRVSQSELQHRFHIRLVTGSHDREIRKEAEINRVEYAMMRGTVGTCQSATVETEDNG